MVHLKMSFEHNGLCVSLSHLQCDHGGLIRSCQCRSTTVRRAPSKPQSLPQPSVSMFVILVWCTALLGVSTSTTVVNAATVNEPLTTIANPDLSRMLSLSNLGEYNQLVDCLARIRTPFTRCNEEAQRKGEAVLRYVNEQSELGTLLKCCGIWLVRDCWVAAAAHNCTEEQVNQLRNMPTKMMPGLSGLCAKYPAGSSACYTPHVVLGAVVLGTLLLLIVVLISAVFIGRHLYRRRQRSTKVMDIAHDDCDHHSSGHRDHRVAEKVKLTANANAENNNPLNNNNLEFIDSEKANP